MGVADDYAQVVAKLRGWGFQVVEWSGCYGRSNGGSWSAGVPVGHGNHHYVCSMNPDQGYIDNLVANLASGDVVNWFADVHGVAYLIGTGPMNHFGTGNQSVLDRTRSDQPPPGPASSQGSISGNAHYSGTECQHPGDSTPWPGPMLDVMVAINAAEFLVWGYTAARAINHFEWTNRKIDMSAGGGADSGGWAGDELRRRVAARMTGTPEGDWFDMATEADLQRIVSDAISALVPGIVNDVTAGVLRAGEFDLTANGQAARQNGVITDILRADEFQLTAAQRQALGV
jgi:hypothetical protein